MSSRAYEKEHPPEQQEDREGFRRTGVIGLGVSRDCEKTGTGPMEGHGDAAVRYGKHFWDEDAGEGAQRELEGDDEG